ncbi:hypothetical protein Pmani_001207 [Petrolisthes manimaculis]|uniref:Uncharacterized protein n=1 Tax=Petrolisthes manimaculis TaxID=1843537 RepID=A0AAE1QL81_9EUCA|nr:hypothetical protein Pmani_001207 [Petrolisthes manimaculis]
MLPPLLLLLLPSSLGLDPSQMSSPTTATDAPRPLSATIEDVAEEGTTQNYATTTTTAELQGNQEITTNLPDNTLTQPLPKVTLEYKDAKNGPVDSLIKAEDQVRETSGVAREKGSVVWTKMKENGEREWRDVNEWGNGKTERQNIQAEVKDTEVKDGKGNEEDWVIGVEEEGSKRTDSSDDAEHNKSFSIDDDSSSPKYKDDMDLSIIERFLLDSSEDSVMLPPNESSALGSLSDLLKNTPTLDTKMTPPEQDDPVIIEAKEEYMNIWNREAELINAPYLKVTKVWPEMGIVYMPLVTEMSDKLRSSQPVKEALERYKAIWRERNAHTAPSPSTSGGPIIEILGNFMGAWSWLNNLTESRVDVTDANNNTGDVNDKDHSNTLQIQNRSYTGASKVIIDLSEGDGWQDMTTSSNKESFKNYYYIPATSQSVSALHPLWYPPNPSHHPHPTHRPLIPLHQEIPIVPGTRPTPILPIIQGIKPSIPIPVHKPGVIDADGPIGTAPSHTPPICPVAIMPSPVSPIPGSGPTGAGGGVSDSILHPSDSISPPPRPFPIIKPIISSLRPIARLQPRPAVNQIPSLKRAGYPDTQFTPTAANTPAEHTPIARHTLTSNTSADPVQNLVAAQNPIANHRPVQNPIANHRPVQNPVAVHKPVQNPVANHRPVQNPVANHRPVQNPVANHRPVQNPVANHRPVQNPVANHRPARYHFAYHSPDSQHFVVHVPEGSGIDYHYSDRYYNEYQSPRDFIVTSTVQYPARHQDYHTDPSAFYSAPTRSEVSSGVPHRTGHHGDNYQHDLGMQSYNNPTPYESTRGSYDLGTDSGTHESDTNTSSYESRTEDMISLILHRLLNPKTKE